MSVIALLIFAVAGLAVAAEQPKDVTVGDCTCSGLNKNTNKPWTEPECRSACDMQKSLGINQFSSLGNPTLIAQVSPDGQDQKPSQEAPLKEITRPQFIAGLVMFTLLMATVAVFAGWRIMKQGPQWVRKKYKTDQNGRNGQPLPHHQPAPAPPPPAPPPTQLSVVGADPPEPPAVQYPEKIVNVAGRRDQMENITFWLGKTVSPELYPWVHWGLKLSAFTMSWRGFQAEMEICAGGIEISVQEENRELFLEILLYGISEVYPVSLKLVLFEQTAEGAVYLLMPEESVQLALTGKCNVVELTNRLRQDLLPSVHVHRRAIGD